MSSNSAVTPSTETPTESKLLGRVKWFNNKAGYGFITVTDGNRSGSDIFVHHAAIAVSSQQYKYLVQGEYVEFVLSDIAGGVHQFNATNVTGVKGGTLMCETRRESKGSRVNYKSNDRMPSDTVRPPRIYIPDADRSASFRQNRDMTRPHRSYPDRNSTPRSAPTPRARGGGPRDGQDGQKDWCMVDNYTASSVDPETDSIK